MSIKVHASGMSALRLRPVFIVGAALLVQLSVSGCSRKQPGAAAGASASQAAAPPVPDIPASAQVTSIPLPKGAGPLTGRLQQEAASRPPGAIKAETVFGVVQEKGVHLHEIEQAMGYPIGAKYCAGAMTDHNVFLSVCEFTDPAAAAAGKTKADTAFGSLPLRQSVVNRSSLLTVRETGNTPESAEQAKMLATTFTSL